MRIFEEDFVIEIKCAWRDGKRLVFKTLDDVTYCTDDYFSDNIAFCKLNDLVVDGYLKVKEIRTM